MTKITMPLLCFLIAGLGGVSSMSVRYSQKEQALLGSVLKVTDAFARDRKLSVFLTMGDSQFEESPDASSSDALGLQVKCDMAKNPNCWKTGDPVKDALIWMKYAKKNTNDFHQTISGHMMDGMKADVQNYLDKNKDMQKEVDAIVHATQNNPEVLKACEDCPGEACKEKPHIKAQCMIYSMVKSESVDASIAHLADGLEHTPKLSFMAEAQKVLKSGNPLTDALADPDLTVTCDTKKEPMCWKTGDKKKDALIWLKYSLIWQKINKAQKKEFNDALSEHMMQGVRQDMQNYLTENPDKMETAMKIKADPKLAKKCKNCLIGECDANTIFKAQCLMYSALQWEEEVSKALEYK